MKLASQIHLMYLVILGLDWNIRFLPQNLSWSFNSGLFRIEERRGKGEHGNAFNDIEIYRNEERNNLSLYVHSRQGQGMCWLDERHKIQDTENRTQEGFFNQKINQPSMTEIMNYCQRLLWKSQVTVFSNKDSNKNGKSITDDIGELLSYWTRWFPEVPCSSMSLPLWSFVLI